MARKPGRETKSQPAPSADEIRRRAYRIWEEEGRPHGRDAEHWSRAERETAESAERPERSAVAPRKPRTRPASTPSAGKVRKK